MIYLVTVIHVLVSLFLVLVVLLQSGKAADLAGAFGGMGSQTVFGPRGAATALSKATTISVVVFLLTSLTLSIMSTGTVAAPPSLLDDLTAPATTQSAPATTEPATTPAPAEATPAPAEPAPAETK